MRRTARVQEVNIVAQRQASARLLQTGATPLHAITCRSTRTYYIHTHRLLEKSTFCHLQELFTRYYYMLYEHGVHVKRFQPVVDSDTTASSRSSSRTPDYVIITWPRTKNSSKYKFRLTTAKKTKTNTTTITVIIVGTLIFMVIIKKSTGMLTIIKFRLITWCWRCDLN